MTRSGDPIVLFLLVGVIFYIFLRKWFSFASMKDWIFNTRPDPEPLRGDIPAILQEYGYEAYAEKQKIPLQIKVGEESFDSRMFIDVFATDEYGNRYAVITSRRRRPLKKVGASLRDSFFASYLLAKPMGLLYVDIEARSVKEITFQYEFPSHKRSPFPWSYIVVFILGMLVAWSITK
ncbi:hypothetical protein J2Z48_002863 [Croceifilum oryzae]|uniref:Uncharacterized protein n=1 Tax=Croceifilum oryzae TaxID=1553429 RepID=A0AAJ1WTC6_9BACL|nr:hypothetical protein [Croceifilum oryzae]MDQ0418660.1 hypothetical protein [Croceifilum oryzae]